MFVDMTKVVATEYDLSISGISLQTKKVRLERKIMASRAVFTP